MDGLTDAQMHIGLASIISSAFITMVSGMQPLYADRAFLPRNMHKPVYFTFVFFGACIIAVEAVAWNKLSRDTVLADQAYWIGFIVASSSNGLLSLLRCLDCVQDPHEYECRLGQKSQWLPSTFYLASLAISLLGQWFCPVISGRQAFGALGYAFCPLMISTIIFFHSPNQTAWQKAIKDHLIQIIALGLSFVALLLPYYYFLPALCLVSLIAELCYLGLAWYRRMICCEESQSIEVLGDPEELVDYRAILQYPAPVASNGFSIRTDDSKAVKVEAIGAV